MSDFITRLKTHVDSEDFFKQVLETLEGIVDKDRKLKLMLELVKYVHPSVRPTDKPVDIGPPIKIVYERIDEKE